MIPQVIPQVRGFQGCYLDNHRNNWRCARAVRENAPLHGTPPASRAPPPASEYCMRCSRTQRPPHFLLCSVPFCLLPVARASVPMPQGKSKKRPRSALNLERTVVDMPPTEPSALPTDGATVPVPCAKQRHGPTNPTAEGQTPASPMCAESHSSGHSAAQEATCAGPAGSVAKEMCAGPGDVVAKGPKKPRRPKKHKSSKADDSAGASADAPAAAPEDAAGSTRPDAAAGEAADETAAQYVAVQHALAAAVREALDGVAADMRDVVRVIAAGDNADPDVGPAETVAFRIEGGDSEFCVMAQYNGDYDEVMTVCYDLPDAVRRSLAHWGLSEGVLAGYTCIQWFAARVWGPLRGATGHIRAATMDVSGNARVWDLMQGQWQASEET